MLFLARRSRSSLSPSGLRSTIKMQLATTSQDLANTREKYAEADTQLKQAKEELIKLRTQAQTQVSGHLAYVVLN